MPVDELLLQALNGLSFGALLFLLASGFTLVFGLMKIVNLAHGAFYLVGGYIGIATFTAARNFLVAVLAGVATAGVRARPPPSGARQGAARGPAHRRHRAGDRRRVSRGLRWQPALDPDPHRPLGECAAGRLHLPDVPAVRDRPGDGGGGPAVRRPAPHKARRADPGRSGRPGDPCRSTRRPWPPSTCSRP